MGHIAKNVPLSHHQMNTSPKKIKFVTSLKIIFRIPVTSPKNIVFILPKKEILVILLHK